MTETFLSNPQLTTLQPISTAPSGRGRRQRPALTVNPTYVRELMERGLLTERDERVLRTVNDLEVLSVGQLARLHWQNLATARHRLRKLYDRHLLDRSEYNPVKMKALGLEPGVVYTLGKAGRLWLDWRTGQKERHQLPPLNSLHHNLVVAETIVALTEAVHLTAPWLLGWQGERSCRVRRQKDDKPVVVLEPDALLAFRQNQTDPGRFYYLEVDLGTENLTVFGQKIKRYESYQRREEWRSRYQWAKFPTVLVVTTTAGRAEGLVETIRQAQTPFFWGVCTLPDLLGRPRADLLTTPLCRMVRAGQVWRRQALLGGEM